MKKRSISSISKSVSSGITPLRSNPDFWTNGTIPWLKTEQLGERLIFDANEKISEKALDETGIKVNPVDTISIAMYGEGKTRGNVSLLKREMTTNQACCNIVLDKDQAAPEFVYYCLKNQYANLRRLSSGVRQNLNSGDIKGFEINIPERVSDQIKIASVLSALDAKIELNNQINAELEGMAKLLYDYWFVQYDFPMSAAQAASLGRPELAGHPYRSSGGKLVPNETLNRPIPEGWSADTLDKLGEVVGGTTPSKENDAYYCTAGIPWITPKDLSNNKGNKFIDRGEIDVTEAGQKNSSLKIMPAGSVLLSSRAPIGYTAIASNPLTTNQGFKSFVPNKGYSSDFIYQTLNHYMKLIEQNASGSTFKEISGGTLKAIKIPLPQPSLAKLYSEKVASMSAQQQNLEKQNQELTQLRDWLLPMLMNGQVTVQ